MIKNTLRLIVLFICSVSFCQTPEQYYFDWTSLPFSKEELSIRRENLIKQLPEEGLIIIPAKDGFSYGETFRQLDNFYYFTGLELPNSLLVLDLAKKSEILYVPERDLRFESSSRPNDFPGRPILRDSNISQNSGLSFKNIEDFLAAMDAAAKSGKTIFVDIGKKGTLSFPEMDYIATPSPVQILCDALKEKHSGLRFENIYEAVAKVRMIKSPAEIDIMRKVTAINIEGIKTAAKTIKAGIDERYLEGVLEGNYKVNGAHRLAFGSIIKSGPNSLWPWRILATHYNRRNRVMENGDLVIFDVGCEYHQYVSDMGRTFPVSGKFTDKQKEILTMEVGIADQIIDFIKPGITFADIKKLTDTIIPDDAKKYMQVGLFFGHHLGLSTGDPNLPEAKLEPGMIFTVEPWYYNHDDQISVFTEDVILVTEEGCEVLSKSLPRTPSDLEKLMKK
ncbi:M24 family metallopeptidase [Maribacter halichondriae]|uniref:M24 family metallopeptidase n=1 Tax=Maribacter halichondriae TaxID=2980554 RepID=UPI002358AD8C|nr:Xaa-Pro peptidase family protein [Maribacter sp. Hal144]